MQHESIFNEIINNTHVPIMVLDDNWIIKIFNKEAEKLTGYNAKELIGLKSIKDIQINSNRQDDLYATLVKDGKVYDYETFLLRKDSGKLPVVLSLSKIYHINSTSYDILTIMLDFSNRKKIELNYLQKIRDLEEKGSFPIKETQKRHKLFRLVKHDYDNSYMVSTHFLNLLMTEMFGPLKPMQKDKLEDIQLEFDKMRKRIYDLDFLYKIDLNNLDIQREHHQLSQLFNPVYDQISKVYSRKGYYFENNLPPNFHDVYCDNQIIKQVFFELMLDSIREGGVGCTIKIYAEKDLSNERKLVVTIATITPEVSEEERVYFESLMSDRTEDDKEQNKGLGLIFCEQVLEAINERFWYEKKSFTKSSFHFTLEHIQSS